MLEGWRSRGTHSAHLIFGQHYHSALELYDKLRVGSRDGQKWAHDEATCEVVVHLLQWTWVDGAPWNSDHPAKNRESLVRSVVWYLEEFKDDSCETVVLANGKPAVELSFKFDSGIPLESDALNLVVVGGTPMDEALTLRYVMSGHLDRLATFQGDTYVMDRKTSGTALTAHFFQQFNPHNQMSLYTIAGEVIFGTAIKGVIIDGAQVAVGFTRFGRGFTARTPGLSAEYLADLEPWLRAAERYAAANHWPKNELACGNYGGCTFRKICSLDPGVRQRFLETEYERNHWNPLQSRD